MSIINSGEKFFAFLEASGLIDTLIDENPLSYVDYDLFEKELMKLFKNVTVSQTAIKASNWVRNEIRDMNDRIDDGQVDPWSDRSRIYEFYKTQINVKVWRWTVAQQARETRLQSLRLELLTVDKRKPIVARKLKKKIDILDERRAQINAWGPFVDNGPKWAEELHPLDDYEIDEDENPFLMVLSDQDESDWYSD